MSHQDPDARAGLGWPTLSALVVANMIGAGIFTSSGYSLAALGSPGRVMLAWWICGVWAISGAVAYGALVSRLPMSGGEYLFLSRLVHPSIGFLAGWVSVIAGFTAPIAAAALGAAVYSVPKSTEDDMRLALVATLVIVVATVCHLIGLSIGAAVQNTIVAAKLFLIAIVVGWAFLFTPSESWQGAALPHADPGWLPQDFGGWTVLAGSMSWVALSYTGFNAAIYVAGESRNPRRTVPLAMVSATVVVTIIYLLLNYVFVYAPAPALVEGQERVASIAAEAVGGAPLAWLVRLTIVLAMTSSVFAMLMVGPRVYQRMAEDGVMPKFFRSISGSPRIAIIVQAALSIGVLFVADLLRIMKYLGLTLSVSGALAVMSLWWVRRKLPDAPRLKIWETVAMSLYLLITLCILAASRTEHSKEFNAMLITFGVGLIVYGCWAYFEKHREQGSDHR